jgi:hypothetical protein
MARFAGKLMGWGVGLLGRGMEVGGTGGPVPRTLSLTRIDHFCSLKLIQASWGAMGGAPS